MAKFIRTELTLNPKVYKKLERKKQNEKVKEHLYKKWKLYAAALGIIIIITSTGLGVSLGVPWHEIFSNLNHLKLNKTAIPGKENMTAEDAFNAVLANNTKISDLKTNVELSSFIAPSYTTTGSLTIKAKPDGKYNGSVKIKITTIGQTKLSDLNLDTSAIDGKENMKAEDAFNVFLSNNSTISDLKNNVEAGTFTAPSYTTTGKLTVNAKTNSKYSGNVNVTINAIGQTKLSDLNLDTSAIDGKENMKAEDAFNVFLSNNSTISDLKNNVEAGTFTAPSYTTTGKLTVNAKTNSKYSGSLEVNINKIKQTDTKLIYNYMKEIYDDGTFFLSDVSISNIKNHIQNIIIRGACTLFNYEFIENEWKIDVISSKTAYIYFLDYSKLTFYFVKNIT